MALTHAQVVATELERVEPKLTTLFDYDDTFYREIERATDAEVVSSKDLRLPLEIRPGGLFGHFDPDGGDLGLGEGPTFDKALVPVVYLKHAIQWTKKAEWANNKKEKAVLGIARHLLAKSMGAFRRHVDSLCMTDGTGQLATISTYTADTPSAGTHTIVLNGDGFGSRLIRYGQKVSIYFLSGSDWTPRTNGLELKVVYHDQAAKTIQVTGATPTGVVATDKIVVSGLSGLNPVSLYGVKYHHNGSSTGTWLGLNRANLPEIRGNEINAAGALALSHARLALAKVGDRTEKGVMKGVQAWMHPAQVAAFEELINQVTVVNAGGNRNNAGIDPYWDIDNLKIAGIPVRTHWSWDKTRIDLIVKSAWGRAVMQEPGFYDLDGKRIFELRGASGGVATSQIFYLVVAFNLFMRNPIAGAYIKGLNVPTGY